MKNTVIATIITTDDKNQYLAETAGNPLFHPVWSFYRKHILLVFYWYNPMKYKCTKCTNQHCTYVEVKER